MATIVNAADVELQATSPRLVTIPAPTNTTVDFSQVTGATKPSNNADVTTTILTASGTSIVMTNSQLFKSSSGVGGVFIGSGGLIGKNTSGVTTFSINATTGAVTFTGSITGGSTLNITGSAVFGGSVTVGSNTYAGTFNTAGGSVCGLIAKASHGIGVHGVGTQSDDIGVLGLADFYGVMGTTSGTGVGVYAQHTGAGAGFALAIDGGINVVNANSTGSSLASLASNKPGSASTFTWIPCTVNGVSGWIPWAPN